MKEKFRSGEAKRTRGSRAGPFHDVEIDHGGGDIGMAEEILDGSDIGAGFEKKRRERAFS